MGLLYIFVWDFYAGISMDGFIVFLLEFWYLWLGLNYSLFFAFVVICDISLLLGKRYNIWLYVVLNLVKGGDSILSYSSKDNSLLKDLWFD